MLASPELISTTTRAMLAIALLASIPNLEMYTILRKQKSFLDSISLSLSLPLVYVLNVFTMQPNSSFFSDLVYFYLFPRPPPLLLTSTNFILKKFILNSPLDTSVKVEVPSPQFVQWTDPLRESYGLNFGSPQAAEDFTKALHVAIDALRYPGNFRSIVPPLDTRLCNLPIEVHLQV